MDEDAFRRDVPVHDARSLNLYPLLRADTAPHLAADDGFAGDHVAFHFPALADQDLAPGAYRTDDRALDLHHAVGGDVADDPHSSPDDREAGFGFGGTLSLLGEDGHINSPVSRP